MLGTLDVHETLAAGWWPSEDVRYPSVEDRLPALPARFDTIVDHVSRRMLQRPADAALQAACRQVLQLSRGTRFATARAFGKWRMDLLLATVLNSPAHAAR